MENPLTSLCRLPPSPGTTVTGPCGLFRCRFFDTSPPPSRDRSHQTSRLHRLPSTFESPSYGIGTCTSTGGFWKCPYWSTSTVTDGRNFGVTSPVYLTLYLFVEPLSNHVTSTHTLVLSLLGLVVVLSVVLPGKSGTCQQTLYMTCLGRETTGSSRSSLGGTKRGSYTQVKRPPLKPLKPRIV